MIRETDNSSDSVDDLESDERDRLYRAIFHHLNESSLLMIDRFTVLLSDRIDESIKRVLACLGEEAENAHYCEPHSSVEGDGFQ